MSASIVDLAMCRAFRRESQAIKPESTEDKVRRSVMSRCLAAGVPIAAARNAANSACQSVRAGFEPSGCADRAVDRAIKALGNSDGPEAA